MTLLSAIELIFRLHRANLKFKVNLEKKCFYLKGLQYYTPLLNFFFVLAEEYRKQDYQVTLEVEDYIKLSIWGQGPKAVVLLSKINIKEQMIEIEMECPPFPLSKL